MSTTQPEEVNWDEFEEDQDLNMDTLFEVCTYKRMLMQDIDDQKEKLKRLNEEHRHITEDVIPGMLLDKGLSEIKLKTGEKVTIKKVYTGHIKAEDWLNAEQYLKDSGNDSIIKSECKVDFGKGRKMMEASVLLMQHLREQNLPYKAKSFVHPMTLKSFIKENMESGTENFPMGLFGANIINQAVVK